MTDVVTPPRSGPTDHPKLLGTAANGAARPALQRVSVAVVIPFFQRQPGILARSLRSIARQRLDGRVSVEVVVVDDGSPCRPEAEIESAGGGLSVRVIGQVNGGPGAARNTGLDHVPREVDFVAFLDSDDEWRPDHLANAVAALEEDCDLYFCDNQPYEFEHSYFSEIGKQTGGAVDVANLPGVDRAAERGEPPRPGSLSFPSEIALAHMTRFYLAHTSTIVIRRETVGHVRFDRSLRVAGEDYLYIISVAGQAQRVCYTLGVQVDRGRGINLYMGSVGWGHPGNLSLILDNLSCFTKARGLRLGGGASAGIAYRIRSYRTEFLYAWLRCAVVERRVDLPILWRAFEIDAGLLVFGPYLVATAVYRKLSGGRAVDHFNGVQQAAARGPSL